MPTPRKPAAATSKAAPAVAPSMKGKMPKGNPEVIARLDKIMTALPAYRRPMFGTVARFLDTNAQMFASSFSGKWGDYDPDGMDGWKEQDGS